MEYNGFTIEEDKTGYAPKHLRFHFYSEDDEYAKGSGESIEDCQKQINENIVYYKLMKNGCYSVFNFNGTEIHKNCISKSEVYAFCRFSDLKLLTK